MGSCLTHLNRLILSMRVNSLRAQLKAAIEGEEDGDRPRERAIEIYGIYIDYLACEEKLYWEKPRLRDWFRREREKAAKTRDTYIAEKAALEEKATQDWWCCSCRDKHLDE